MSEIIGIYVTLSVCNWNSKTTLFEAPSIERKLLNPQNVIISREEPVSLV